MKWIVRLVLCACVPLLTSCGTQSPGANLVPPSAPSYELSVLVLGNGSVVRQLDGRDTTATRFDAGQEVTLIARPPEGWKLNQWGRDASGTEASITVVMDSDKTVLASFTRLDGPITGSWIISGLPHRYLGSFDNDGYFAFDVHHDGTQFYLANISYDFRTYCDHCPDRPNLPVECVLETIVSSSNNPCEPIGIANGVAECSGGKLDSLRIQFQSTDGSGVLGMAIVTTGYRADAILCQGRVHYALENRVAWPVK